MRSPFGLREGGDPDLSFLGWKESDPLPDYEDHVGIPPFTRPHDNELVDANPGTGDFVRPTYRPYHPAFGEQSMVVVNQPQSVGSNPTVVIAPVTLSTTPPDNGTSVPSAPTGPAPRPSLYFSEAYSSHTGPIDFRFLPRPPPEHNMFNSSGPRGASFSIRLIFTGFDRPSQVYRVYETMPVRVLHYRIAFQVLLVDPRGLRLFVENRPLLHRGTINDRFDPRAPNAPTPNAPSVLEVRLVQIGTFGPAVFQPQFALPGSGIEPEDG
jgi:hypothetical protein